MGATGWRYYVRHQPDVDAALQELRQDVFRRGEYETGPTEEELEAIRANFSPQMKALYEMAKRWEQNKPPKPKPIGPPKTIEELVERKGESGTHSILDINHIAAEPEFGALAPLSERQLLDFFGTAQPTREQVEKWGRRIVPVHDPPLYRRWQGIYSTVYKEGVPDELYFEGASGD